MDLLNLLMPQVSDDVNQHGVFNKKKDSFIFRSPQIDVTVKTAQGICGWYSGCNVTRRLDGFGWAPSNSREFFSTEAEAVDSTIKFILNYYGSKTCDNLIKQYEEWRSLNT